MKCPYCNKEHSDDYMFCPKIGKKINHISCNNPEHGCEFENHPNDVITGCCNSHDFVDLGLPSGVMWATCNMGAKIPKKRETIMLGTKLKNSSIPIIAPYVNAYDGLNFFSLSLIVS